jgi:hypothetical protein
MGKKRKKFNIPHTYRKPTQQPNHCASQHQPPNSEQEKLSWQIRILDFGGPWGWDSINANTLKYIHSKLALFESMTWVEVNYPNTGCHPIKVEEICATAQKRLAEIQVLEEELFSLRLSGKERLWGIRERHILKILWWDPKHEVYPVIAVPD